MYDKLKNILDLYDEILRRAQLLGDLHKEEEEEEEEGER